MQKKHWLLVKLAVTIVVIIVALWRWGPGASFFLGLLVASGSGLLSGRVSAAIGLLCLAACPLLLIAEQYAWLQRSSLVNYYAANMGLYTFRGAADEVAIWAYYFLSIAVVAQIIHYFLRERARR